MLENSTAKDRPAMQKARTLYRSCMNESESAGWEVGGRCQDLVPLQDPSALGQSGMEWYHSELTPGGLCAPPPRPRVQAPRGVRHQLTP